MSKPIVSYTLSMMLAISMLGCTASIQHIPQHDMYTEYDYFATNDKLEIGLDVVERPERGNPSLNQKFQKRGILAVSVKLRNISKNVLSLPVEDWSLRLQTDQFIPAMRIDSVARMMTGSPFGRTTQAIFLFYEDVRYQYLRAGLPDMVVLQPSEELFGFLFFPIDPNKTDIEITGLSIQVAHLKVIRREQVNLSLQADVMLERD